MAPADSMGNTGGLSLPAFGMKFRNIVRYFSLSGITTSSASTCLDLSAGGISASVKFLKRVLALSSPYSLVSASTTLRLTSPPTTLTVFLLQVVHFRYRTARRRDDQHHTARDNND